MGQARAEQARVEVVKRQLQRGVEGERRGVHIVRVVCILLRQRMSRSQSYVPL